MSAGKGDKPRNCFTDKFRSNYNLIIWNKNNQTKNIKKACTTTGKTVKYYK